jgi:hypothetical protein
MIYREGWFSKNIQEDFPTENIHLDLTKKLDPGMYFIEVKSKSEAWQKTDGKSHRSLVQLQKNESHEFRMTDTVAFFRILPDVPLKFRKVSTCIFLKI